MNASPGKKIAVIDDDEDYRVLCGEALNLGGYEYQTYSSAQDALDALQDPEAPVPDLILVDMMMPGMSGEEFLRMLRRNPRATGTKVYFASGKSDVEARTADLDADGYLRKPFDLDELYRAVDKALAS